MTQMILKGLRLGAALGLALTLFGCPNRELGPVEPVVQSGTSIVITQAESDAVDLLVLVDNSNSMAQEQANLATNFPILIDRLTDPPDSDGDGQSDYPPVSDLHIGVVDTDMGTGGYAVTTCENAVDGDDGILQNTPSDLVANCDDSYPSYLSWGEDDDAAALSQAFSCIAVLGTGGCGFEQQLKAVRKALTDHAAGANAGFLRDDSLLAILMVTDEEDCSVREDVRNATDIFNTQLQLGPLNLRCFAHRDQYVAPVDYYVDAILALRPDNPERLVVAGIVGIPPDSSCNLTNMTDSDFQCLLDHPKMQEVVDNSAEGQGERLTPSCDVPGLGEAFPPRRIVEFIKQINHEGNNGIVQSICEADFGPAMRAITSLIQSKVLGACLARPLDPNASNQVRCIVQETLTTSDDCPPGRIDLGVTGEQRRCQICQKGDGEGDRTRDELGQDLTECSRFNASGDYWEYVPGDQSADCPSTGKVNFQGSAVPLAGSVVHLECLSKVGDE
ncbi:MAG: hypothetical protein HYY06_07835 [Deltaproteobacteria bacterium]|nr:hypothetical protein [Deltaproteobacteria bacterium]